MADIAVGTVVPGSTVDIRNGTCGVAITAGDPLRLNSSTGRYEPAKADTESTATVVGCAVHDAAVGQPIAYAASGPIAIASVATKGTVYVLSSANAGGIAPWADLGSGDTVTVLAVATSTSGLLLKIHNSATVI